MDTKHTPGPWRIERGGGHAYNSICGAYSIQIYGWENRRNGISNVSYSDRICENLGNLELPGPAANAHLIAAAPELLKALALLLEAHTNNTLYGGNDHWDNARSAIAKATGEQK